MRPTSALDPRLVGDDAGSDENLANNEGMTMVIVTHDGLCPWWLTRLSLSSGVLFRKGDQSGSFTAPVNPRTRPL